MSQTLSTQHPAVVLRSRYQQLRALLVVAMIAVVGLTVAVVVLAAQDEPATGAGSATKVVPGPALATHHPSGHPDESAIASFIAGN